MRGIHGSITSLGRLRTEFESRSNRAMMIQLETRDEPPAARNGAVRPVSGMTRVTPPTTMKICSASAKPRPSGEELAEVVLPGKANAQGATD